MLHFVMLQWPKDSASASEAAAYMNRRLETQRPDLRCVFSGDGIVVRAQATAQHDVQVHRLGDRRGVILGRVFPAGAERFSARWQPTFGRGEAEAFAKSKCRALMERYWGNYIAFVRDDLIHSDYAVRDCSGKFPCYRTRHDGVQIVFADIADLTSLELPAFTVNEDYLAAFIYSPQLQIRECGLNEVTEVLAGECVEFSKDAVRQFPLWDPGQISRDSIDDCGHAVEELRRTTKLCVSAWSSAFGHILHKLSGGLDSAIVLACLRQERDADGITCLNMFGDNPREDERSYARQAAAMAGTRLLEDTLDSASHSFDERQFALPRTPKPTTVPLLAILNTSKINKHARDVGADTVWTGQGGDHLFLQDSTPLCAVDYVRARGVRPGLLRVAADAARRSRMSYASLARICWQATRERHAWRPNHLFDRPAAFVRSERLPSSSEAYLRHPWTQDSLDLGECKQAQIYFLAEVLNRQRPMSGIEQAYEHHPLLSQPLIELCLRIPSYLLLQGGRQRALAREAFADCVPAAIIRREDKGDITFTVTDTIRRSEGFLKELLFDGFLAQRSIVDVAQLEAFVLHKQPFRLEHCSPLLACVAVECWARSWQAANVRAAA